ncbi:MAG TPA: acyltransferase [Candidatus Dormibacteraeota bacterium]|nr:acyltransferase [Candidatus Dormibacteraeota bacterium]
MGQTTGRDRFMDLLRLGSLLAIVAGHWLGIVPNVQGGVISGVMVYDVDPRYWPATWLFDVIPLFFFVGGFANAISYRRLREAGRASEFRPRRLARLLVPTLVFIGVWLAIEAVLAILDAGGSGPLRGMRWGFMTPFAPLWFLGVYLVVVLLVPITLRLHERFGILVPAVMAAGVLAVDWMAFGLHHPSLLGINIVLAWLLPGQLGYFYADGRLQRVPARLWAWLAVSLLVLLVLLTSLPSYGRNLLDNGVAIIGVTAPTMPFVVASMLAIATAMAARNWLERHLNVTRVRAAVTRLTPLAMTIFLWHMTSYFAAVALMAAIPVPFPATPNATWWLERPLFLLLPAVLLLPLMGLFGRFERPPREHPGSEPLAAVAR